MAHKFGGNNEQYISINSVAYFNYILLKSCMFFITLFDQYTNNGLRCILMLHLHLIYI